MLDAPDAEGGKHEKIRVRINRAQPCGGFGPIDRSALQGREGEIREVPGGQAEDVPQRQGPLHEVQISSGG
jgi:hypothetical protein